MSNHPRIVTFTGRTINPLQVRPDDLDINDIAHALSLCNRFAGHTTTPISVAKHSLLVASLVAEAPVEVRRQALLHDATEAYLGDVTKWLKQHMPAFIEAEDRLWRTIATWARVDVELHPLVKRADNVAVMVEGATWMNASLNLSGPNYAPLTEQEQRIANSCERLWMDWQTARQGFLSTHWTLGGPQ